jgi:hypothetical protein
MQTPNFAYHVALTKAKKFNTAILSEMEPKADTAFLVKLKVEADTLCKILKEGTTIGNRVNEVEYKMKLIASVISITSAIFLAETLTYINAQQKKRLLEQLTKFTVPVATPNIN